VVRRALADFPELEVRSLLPLGEGWDRSVWLVDDAWVFGFARREVVLTGIANELEFLPRLAPLLPLPIPVPRFAGATFVGSAYLPGSEAIGLADDERVTVAAEVAAFLRRLHDLALPGAERLPLDPNGRADMHRRVPMARAALAELGVEATGILDAAERLRPPTRACVVHGDLHFRHVLVEGGHASGVIDWIDLCRADPAVDLQLYWSFLPPSRRHVFADAYGPVDENAAARPRARAAPVGRARALRPRGRPRRDRPRGACEPRADARRLILGLP
jgi:aminoglycoside phosphotransferase (APT) family kinase protein